MARPDLFTYLIFISLNHCEFGIINFFDRKLCVFNDRINHFVVPCPANANIVTCKWVFTIKYHLEGTIAHHKARLVARGFTQVYVIDYTETFSPIVRLNFVRVLLSLAVNQACSLHQLDVSNAFLYGDLEEQVFMEQPPLYVAQGESSKVCFCDELITNSCRVHVLGLPSLMAISPPLASHHARSIPPCSLRRLRVFLSFLPFMLMTLFLTGSDDTSILATKTYLQQHLNIHDLRSPRYFLGIEFSH